MEEKWNKFWSNAVGRFIYCFVTVVVVAILSKEFLFIKQEPDINNIPNVNYTEDDVLPANPQKGDVKVYFGEGSDYEMMIKKGDFIEKKPLPQPSLISSYENNTAKMVSYMKSNSFKITLNSPVPEGYLYFRIKTTGTTNVKDGVKGKLFFYIARDNTSGYLDTNSAVYAKNENGIYDLLFDIKNIKYFPYGNELNVSKELNLIKRLSYFGRTDYISTFWVNNTGATIEKITLAYGGGE